MNNQPTNMKEVDMLERNCEEAFEKWWFNSRLNEICNDYEMDEHLSGLKHAWNIQEERIKKLDIKNLFYMSELNQRDNLAHHQYDRIKQLKEDLEWVINETTGILTAHVYQKEIKEIRDRHFSCEEIATLRQIKSSQSDMIDMKSRRIKELEEENKILSSEMKTYFQMTEKMATENEELRNQLNDTKL